MDPPAGPNTTELMLLRMLLMPTAVLYLLGAAVLEECTPWDI